MSTSHVVQMIERMNALPLEIEFSDVTLTRPPRRFFIQSIPDPAEVAVTYAAAVGEVAVALEARLTRHQSGTQYMTALLRLNGMTKQFSRVHVDDEALTGHLNDLVKSTVSAEMRRAERDDKAWP